MKNIVHIKSQIPASIAINGQLFDTSKMDVMYSNNFYVTFYPRDKDTYMPCVTAIESDLLPPEIKKVPFNNGHCDIIYNPTKIPQQNNEIVILNKKYKNTIFTIKNSSQSFITISNSTKSHCSTTRLISSTQFKTIDEYAIIIGNCDTKHTYLLIYNTQKQSVVVENIFEQVEISKSNIKALKQEKSIVGYGSIYEFSTQTKSLNKYYAYIEKTTNLGDNNEIVVMSFLESVKYGDYKNSLKYFENSPSIEHIKNYFGDIKEIHFNGYSEEVNFTVLSDCKYRNFTFSLNNHKIVEIEENKMN